MIIGHCSTAQVKSIYLPRVLDLIEKSSHWIVSFNPVLFNQDCSYTLLNFHDSQGDEIHSSVRVNLPELVVPTSQEGVSYDAMA